MDRIFWVKGPSWMKKAGRVVGYRKNILSARADLDNERADKMVEWIEYFG